MKKLLVVLLTLALCVSMLASCDFLKNFADIRGEGNNQETPKEFNVDAAAEYIYNLYKNKSVTATDFEVTAVANIAGVPHTVEWSVDTNKVSIKVKDANTFIVDVDEESPEELAYVLTATIKGGDKTATKSFNLTVPKYVLTPFEEYIDMTEGNVVVKGIVVGINSKAAGNTRNHLFLVDLAGKGGYYSYQMDADPVADLGIEVGMIVEVSGPVSPYSGMQEIKGGVARIVDSTIHEFDIVDITEAFANGSSLKNYVGMLVTIKGVEITGQELGGTSEYLKFKLNGKEAYVRTYVTDFPTSLKETDKATIDAAHLEHFGWNANATGILVLYNSNPYLIPVGVDCFEYLELIVKTDEEKIADVIDQLKLGTSYTSNAVVDLPTAVYPEVVLTWTSNNTDLVAIADGKLTVTVPDAATEVIVTVTATCGDKTATKEFTLKLSKTAESIKDIIDLGASMGHNQNTEEKHLVAGIISEVYNTTYGNMKIVDELGNVLTIYGTYSADGSTRYDAMENAPVAGDYVVIFGIVGQYSGTPQVKNGWIMSITKPTSVKDAIDTGASMEHDTYTEGKVIVTGVITEVYNTKYGNMRITDAEGNILTIYGTYSSTGANRYDTMEGAPVAGDTVTIYGILGQYSGTPQIKNGWIVAVTKGSDTPECTEHVDADGDEKCDVCGADVPAAQPPVEDPAADSTLTIEQVLALGASKEHNTYTEGKYYVTGVITEVYNAQYGNMKITDESGNILTIYGTFNADGTVRYDSLEVKPVAGDTITVYGIVGQYNGTPQVKNGWIVKHTVADAPACEHAEEILPAVDATCTETGLTEGKKCSKCGEILIEQTVIAALGHTFVDGKCACGAEDPNYNPETPEAEWTLVTELKDGDRVLIGAPAYGKLLSALKVSAGSYYNKGVDYSADNFANVTDDEIFVVTVNADGSYTFTSLTGVVIALADSYSSLNADGAHKSWTLKANGDGTFLVYNTGRKTYLEWYNSKGNWSTYTAGNTAEYYLSFYVKTSDSGETPDPECKHTNTVVEGATEATCNTAGFTGNTVCTDCKAVIANGEEIPATGKHTFEKGKCTVCGAEDPNYVKPDEPVTGPVTASKEIKDLIAELGWTSSTTKQEFNLDENVTVKIDGGSNSGKAYNGDHIRVYATDTPAGTITINVAEGYELVSIKVTTVTGTYAFLYVSGTTTDISNVSTAVSGSSVVLETVKNGSNGKQVRVLAIEVVYQPVA